ncbi:MAG: hypothetical protein A2Z83_09385 [Omnitrophica bacterium GWA2_52_8]|nr:MAG: hypothetical protein A2Z83_09385 [Omnitrophica bacterium GWA2_52_8]
MTIRLEDVPFFHDFSGPEFDALKQCLVEKEYAKDELLHEDGSGCSRIFFVKTGRIKIFRLSADGHEQIYEVLGPGDTCACNPGNAVWHCTSSAQAVSPSTVWYLSRDAYVRMAGENTHLMRAINNLFAKRLRCFNDLIEEFALKDTRKRLVKFLLDMQKSATAKTQKDGILFIPFTREEIAHRLGAARETIARHISDLKRKKMVDVKPYQIIIRDRQALEKLLS